MRYIGNVERRHNEIYDQSEKENIVVGVESALLGKAYEDSCSRDNGCNNNASHAERLFKAIRRCNINFWVVEMRTKSVDRLTYAFSNAIQWKAHEKRQEWHPRSVFQKRTSSPV